ncbi:MAG: hypothetical protein NT027_01575 [Proteobacteria bacterium]|nr:hypothetical protein [Pseudomonadota bacterium]
MSQPNVFLIAFAHLHNLVAVSIAIYMLRHLFKQPKWANSGFLIAFFLLYIVSAFGVIPFSNDSQIAEASASMLTEFAPKGYQQGLFASFAFAQLVHLLFWTFVLPLNESRQGRSKHQLLTRSLSVIFLSASVFYLMLPMIANVKIQPLEVKNFYLYFSGFHAWFEISVFVAIYFMRDTI